VLKSVLYHDTIRDVAIRAFLGKTTIDAFPVQCE